MAYDHTDLLDDSAETWEVDGDLLDASAFSAHKANRRRRSQATAVRRQRRGEDGSADTRARPAARRQRPDRPEAFRCRHCRAFVGPVPSGGRHRNHCPVCLYSRHVDDRLPGDRESTCGGSMAPVGYFVRPNGEHTLVHRCCECGAQRHNRIAADDDFALVLRLPDLTRQQRSGQLEVAVEAIAGA